MLRVFLKQKMVRGFVGKGERATGAYTRVREACERDFNDQSTHPLFVRGEL